MPDFLKTAVVVLLGLVAALIIVVGIIGCATPAGTPPVPVVETTEPYPGVFQHIDETGSTWLCPENREGQCYLHELKHPPLPAPQGEPPERSPAPPAQEPSWEPPVRFGPPPGSVTA